MAGADPAAAFVGRASELDILGGCLRTAQRVAVTVLIEGEAGIGKTRLLEEAMATAHELGFQVLSAAAHELERTRPFGVLVDALGLRAGATDPERRAIAERLSSPEANGADESSTVAAGAGGVYPIVEDILAMLERMALTRPVLLAVEDLHWADPSTLVTLSAVARRLGDLPVATICAYRPSPARAELRRLAASLRTHGAVHVPLGPLPEHEVHELATAVAGAAPGPGLRAQLERGHGNPLYIVELVRALATEGVLEVSEGWADASGHGLPPSLRLMLLRRLGYLPDTTLDVLKMAAVLGTSFDVAQLGLVTGRSVVDLTGPLNEALRAGVLGEADDRLTFRHDLIREALYTDLALPIRTGLHLEFGRALADAAAAPIEVAQHLALGASPGDEEAVSWLRDAARQAQSTGPAVAVELLERALQIAGPDYPDQGAVSADLVLARLWSGRLPEAEAQAREALSRPHDPSVATTLRLGLIEALLAQGKIVDVGVEGRAAVSDPGLTGWARDRLLAEAAIALIVAGDREGGLACADAALQESERVGEDLATCIALCARCCAAVFDGQLAAAVTHATEAVERAARSHTSAASTFHSNLLLGWSLALAERPREAEEALRRGRQLSEDLGTVVSLPMYDWVQAWTHYLTGDWDDVVAEAEAGLMLAEQVPSRLGAVVVHGILALIALHRGDLTGADRALATVESQTAGSVVPFGEQVPLARALVAEARGDEGAAQAALSAAWDDCTTMRAVIGQPALGPDLVRLLVAGGQGERATAVTEQVEEAASRMGVRWAGAAALRCRGLADASPDALLEAVIVLRAAPRPLELALACEDAAVALAHVARAPEAVALLNEALTAYDKLGAAHDISRVEARLRTLGHPSHRRGWRQRQAKVGWEALTRTELKVVGLVGEGMTNREVAGHLYISPRTVECHLGHVFGKLNLSSRAALRAEVARRGGAARVSHR